VCRDPPAAPRAGSGRERHVAQQRRHRQGERPLEPIGALLRLLRGERPGTHRGERGPQAPAVRRAVSPRVRAAGERRHLPEPALFEPRHRDPADVVAVELFRRLGAVGRHRAAARRAHTEREHGNSFIPEPGRRLLQVIVLGGLAVAHEQYRPVAPLALVLEDLGDHRERATELGGRIAEIIGARRVEEQLERAVVGRERELQKGASAEDGQAHAVALRGGHRLPRRRLCRREPARRHVGNGHRAGEIEQHQHVAPAARELRLPFPELRARQRQQAERHRGGLKPRAALDGALVGQPGAVREHRRLAELAELRPPAPHTQEHRSRDERHQDEREQQHQRRGEAHGRLRSRVAPSRSPVASSTNPGASAQA
jgi:hypothetical protein